MPRLFSKRGSKLVDKARKATPGKRREVPGPTDNPATNLMMVDVAIRAGSYIARRSLEKGFLRGRYGTQTAKDIVQNRTLGQTLFSFALARVATRSIPGAMLVGGGAVAKTLLNRRKSRLRNKAEGDRELIEQANDE